MKGPIYFGGLNVTGHAENSMFYTDRVELENKLRDQWKQEVRMALKFINDSNLDMKLLKDVLLSSDFSVTIQEFQETNDAA